MSLLLWLVYPRSCNCFIFYVLSFSSKSLQCTYISSAWTRNSVDTKIVTSMSILSNTHTINSKIRIKKNKIEKKTKTKINCFLSKMWCSTIINSNNSPFMTLIGYTLNNFILRYAPYIFLHFFQINRFTFYVTNLLHYDTIDDFDICLI